MNHFSTQYFIRAFAKTDKGNLRANNEDKFTIFTVPPQLEKQQEEIAQPLPPKGCVFVVADGLGGAKAGEIASEIAAESILHQFQELIFLPEDEEEMNCLLKNIIMHAHEEIVAYADMHKQLKGMGTTIVLVWLLEDKLYVAWCGDSRCYLIQNEGSMTLLTEDHSKVWELVKKGLLVPEDARKHPQSHIITQALGDKKLPPQSSFKTIPLANYNKILLCSDGLNTMLADTAIAQIFADKNKEISETAQLLVDKANEAGGLDNITVVLAEVTLA